MTTAVVEIHKTQFPDQVRRDLVASLRSREINHKFHYDSIKQTQQWLALHEAYSPSRTDPNCADTYLECFGEAARSFKASHVHLIGLGCGGGQKDSALLRLLKRPGREVHYTPCDVGTAMVLVARETASKVIPAENCFPFVCDLGTAKALAAVFQARTRGAARIFTFFGMIPNFESTVILPRLAKLVGRADLLLFSANLSPGNDYVAGIERVLPLYDNQLTRDWLMTFLLDLGIERTDGKLRFSIEPDPKMPRLSRIIARFEFTKSRQIQMEEERFEFRTGEQVRLFFSYRHTPRLVRDLLSKYGLAVREEWVTNSGEEGVFLCGRG